MDGRWSKSEARREIFEQAGALIGQSWDNVNRPTFVDIIQNFDAFKDLGFDLLAVKIENNGQMSNAWDHLSGKIMRERISSGEWKEVSPGKWRNEKAGLNTRWDEESEKRSSHWNSREEVLSALEDSSQNFRESLLELLRRLTERVQILHKGEIEFTSSIFTEFEIVTYLSCNIFSRNSPESGEASRLGIEILSAKHPRHPDGGNPTARDTSGSSTLSKYYDERYCMFRKNVLKLCHGVVPNEELSKLIGIEEGDLESFVGRAYDWNCNLRNNRKNSGIGREVREVLGVCSRCVTCGKFLTNPRHNLCTKHFKSSTKNNASNQNTEREAFASKNCEIIPFGKTVPCGNPTVLICESCGRGICDIHASKKATLHIQCHSCSK